MNLGSLWYQMGGRFLLFVCVLSLFFLYQFKKRKMLTKDALFDSTVFNDGKESKPLLSVDEKGKVD